MIAWRSLEVRLTLWYSVLLLTGYVVFSVVLWFGARYAVVAAVDDLLDQRLDHLVAYVTTEADGPELRYIEEELVEYVLAVPEGHLTQIRSPDGNQVFPRGAAPPPIQWVDPVGGRDLQTLSFDEAPYRRLVEQVSLVGNLYTVLLASSLETLLVIRGGLIGLFLLATPLALVSSAAFGYSLARRALRPVDQIAATASTIGVTSLSKRLEVPKTGDTLERLSRTLNEMFERLEVSVRRIDQFSADASQELRTPLSVIRTTAELALKHGRTTDEYTQDLTEIKAESERMTELIEVLLALSRDGAETATVNQHDLDLVQLVRAVHGQFVSNAASQRLALELDVPEYVVKVRGSEPALRRLVSSLLENAIAHTSVGSVTLGVEEVEGIRLFVRDTGEGIPEAELERIFDRLYRVDWSRGREGDFRLGLGLSIARRVAEAHDARLSATSRLGTGSEFSLRFPTRST